MYSELNQGSGAEMNSSSSNPGAELVLDTGSGVIVSVTSSADVSSCASVLGDDVYESNQVIDASSLTPLTIDSAECRNFEYRKENTENNTCVFDVSYSGTTNVGGFVTNEIYSVENSQVVVGDTDAVDQKSPLTGSLVVGAIQYLDECQVFPGIAGADRSVNSIVSQYIAQNMIQKHVIGICFTGSVLNDTDFVTFGPGIPSEFLDGMISVPMYSGNEIQTIQTNNTAFQESIKPLGEEGLEEHYYVIINGVQIGDGGEVFPGPFSAIVDSGYPGMGIPQQQIDMVNDIIAENAAAYGFSMLNPYCFGVPVEDESPFVINSIAPNITISLTDTVKFVVPGTSYMSMNRVGPGDWQVCNEISAPTDQQMAFGSSLFLDKFVQMDSDLGVLRASMVSRCPNTISGEIKWTTIDQPFLNGSYSFPYQVVSSAFNLSFLHLVAILTTVVTVQTF
jgi:hypothetical protein